MRRTLPFRIAICGLLISGVCAVVPACSPAHGKPGPGPEVARPEAMLDFPTLYKDNCAGCHGVNGKNGAAISLNNPTYLALAGEIYLREATANGVAGKLMPPFAKSAGGMLTDPQVQALVQGMLKQWGNSAQLAGQNPPPYLATLPAHAEDGFKAYGVYCARCHGASGEGKGKIGSIVDPSYLALVSDQDLRSIVIAGRPDEGMPDWHSHETQPMTDQQITDILAWIASKRVANPGQPYPAHP